MAGTQQTNQNGRPPGAIGAEGLCEESQYGEAGENEHGAHATEIGIHALLLDKDLWQIATTNGENGNDGIEREDKGDTHAGVGGVAILVGEIGRSPEEEEPPNAVGHELTNKEGPRLTEGEALEERNGYLFLLFLTVLNSGEVDILLDVVELSLIDTLVLARLVVSPYPEAHPYVTQHTNNDERHLPAPGTSQQGDSSGSSQRTDRSTAIKDRGGKSTVLGREVFGGSLDGCGEVTCLTDSKNQTARQEKPHRDGGNSHGGIAANLNEAQRLDRVVALDIHRHPATASMQHGTG